MEADKAFKIRKELSEKIAYIQLNGAIMKEMADDGKADQFRQIILIINNLAVNSSDKEVVEKGPEMLKLIDPLCESAAKLYPPKKSISEIAQAYNDYCRENPGHSMNYGILYGWLSQLIDCTRLYCKYP